MKKQFSFFFFILISLFLSTNLSAQKDTVINGTHYKIMKPVPVPRSLTGKRLIPIDSEFVKDNKRFRYYNKWFTCGYGVQQCISENTKLGKALGADFNFHIKRNYFQTGLELTSPELKFYKGFSNYEFHFGYGWRLEDKDVHFSAFGGLSYSEGYKNTQIDSTTINSRYYYQPGLFAQAEIIKKIAFDVGLGASLFVDWNKEQTLVGFRAIVYFSGSYRGKKYYQPTEN